MKHPLISVDTCVDDWAVKSGRTQQAVNEELILTVAMDVARLTTNRDQFHERVVLLPVKDYQAQLPKDFRYVIQAAFKEEPEGCCIKERVSEWVGQIDDCKITTHIDCPTCGEPYCDCGEPFLEVDTNFIWETANPQIFNSHVKHFYRYGHLHHRGACGYYPEWQLLRKRTHNYFNTPHHIQDCLNFHVDHEAEYDIQYPLLKLNRRTGAVLLAYLAIPSDENGYPLIPDLPETYQAIFFSIEEMLALQEYIQSGGQREAVKYDRMKMDAQKWRTMLRNKLKVMSPEDWMNFLQNTWKRILPAYPGSAYRMNRFAPESRFTTRASINTKPYFE